MVASGWLDEVRSLLERGFGRWLTSTQAIGYSELAGAPRGDLLEEAREGTVRRTKNLARRQMAWFRRDPRVRWVEAGAGGAAEVVHGAAAYLEGRMIRAVGRSRADDLRESTRAPGLTLMLLDLDDARPLTPGQVAAMCDRRTGVELDGVIRIVGRSGGRLVLHGLCERGRLAGRDVWQRDPMCPGAVARPRSHRGETVECSPGPARSGSRCIRRPTEASSG